MEVEIKIDPDFKNPKAVIHTAEITEEVTEVSKKLSSAYGSVLTGFIDGKAQIIEPGSVVRFYCMGQRVFAVTDCGELVVRSRLYDLEEKLSGTHFARISNTDNWSLVRQTATHFALLSLTMLPIAYICHWMAHTAAGIISHFAIFIIIYIFIWAVNVVIWKLKINQINKKIE